MEHVETRFDLSNYEVDRPLPIGKKKKVIGLMKYELDGRIIKEFLRFRQKMYRYLREDDCVGKKAKDTKKSVIKRDLKFEDFLTSLEINKKVLKTQQRFRSQAQNVVTEKVNNISLSVNDDKRLQAPN